MSILRADSIRDRAGTGAPDFPNGLTGNLTGTATTATALSGTPNITVGTVTGTDATFSGNLTVNGTTTTIDTAVTAVDSLNVDGAGTFGGVVEIGGDANNGTAEGIELNTSGFLQLSRSGNSALIAGYTQGSSTQTVRIKNNGSANFGQASNSTGNNGVAVGGNNGSLNIYTDRYATDCFQILNTTGSGTNVALQAFGNGNLSVAGTISDSMGPVRRLGQNIQSGNYTLVAGDAGKHIRVDGAHTITVPDNVFTSGDMITIVANSSSDVPITQGSGLNLYNASDGTTGNKTLAARTVCTILIAEGGSGAKAYIAGGGLS